MANDSEKSRSEYRVLHEKAERNEKLKNGDDIKQSVKRTLGDYVSAKSDEQKNKYRISPGAQESSGGIDVNLQGAENPYARQGTEGADSMNVDSGLFPRKSSVQNENGVTNSDLNRKGEDFIDRAVSAGLKRSRFSPDSRVNREKSNWSPQTRLGENSPKEDVYNIEELAKVADALMLKAAGHAGVSNSNLKNTFVALAPGATQLGGRISTSELNPSGLEDSPSFSTVVDESVPNASQRTWGVVNSPSEQYGDKTPAGMAALAIAMTVTLKVVVEGLSATIALAKKDPYDKNTPVFRGPFPLGRRSGVETSDSFFKPREYLGIDNTDNEFGAALDKGIEVFFDFSAGSFKRVAKQPGYYVNLIRSINQSGVDLVNDFSNLGNINGTALEVAETAASIVDGVRNNRIIAFINILAQMGDRSLNIEAMGYDSSQSFSMLDTLPNNPRNRASKVKESKNSMRSAYRNSSSPSSFLFPKAALTANRSLGGDIGKAISGLSGGNSPRFLDGKSRISTEDRVALENELEAEYVPFYFHDLRTNEIVSFHAFLEQLDDTYQAKWKESEVMGRVDPIGTYQNTKRNLNVAFKVAATSKDDFDNMWFKVNKFITMLYPQWSRGRQVSAEIEGQTKSFTQPFSQIQSASPMIRLRVGDVISSNYSKFSLARTFGLGYSETNILENLESSKEQAEIFFSISKDVRERMLQNPAELGESRGYRVGESAFLNPKSFGGYPEARGGDILDRAASFVSSSSINKKSLILANETRVVIVKSPQSDDSMIVKSGNKKVAYYHIKVAGATSNEMTGNYIVSHSDLYPDPKQVENIAINQSGASFANDVAPPNLDFFDSRENAIVRSFEEAGGRGLAGWIKSLNMQEMASPQTTWETSSFGSRAPKMIKISFQFQPIHDIAPGIDEFGFNRAPVYNVGSVSRHISGVDLDKTNSSVYDIQNNETSNIMASKSKKS